MEARRSRRSTRAVLLLSLLLAVLVAPAVVLVAPVSPGGSASAVAGAPPAAARVARIPADPLSVRIERLSPSTVPRRGEVVVAGTIRNSSDSDWSDLAVYLLTSFAPITSEEELAAAVASDPRTEVGTRVVEAGLFVEVPDLAPGERTRFRLAVPRASLGISGEPGVYWLGVHVLGTSDEGRLEGADGRARTFLPLVPPRTEPVPLALGLQVRHRTARDAEGRLAFEEGWEETLGSEGRLRRVLDFGTSAGAWPLTWVLDPAVLAGVASMAEGNPALQLDAEPLGSAPQDAGEGDGDEGEPTDQPTDEATDEPTDEPTDEAGEEPTDGSGVGDPPGEGPGDAGDEDEAGVPEEARADARGWLDQLVARLVGDEVLAVPYGDLDVSAVTRHGAGELVDAAFEQGDLVMQALGLSPAASVLFPKDGYLSTAAATGADPGIPVILAPGAVDTEPLGDATGTPSGPVLERSGGGRLVLAPTDRAVKGPGPGRTRSPIAVRQRLLADAALQALAGSEAPLVRFLPAAWDPGPVWDRARFFAGLDVDWLEPVPFEELTAAPPSSTAPDGSPGLPGSLGPQVDLTDAVRYPEEEAAAEVPGDTVTAARALIEAGELLAELLRGDEEAVDDAALRQALLAPSLWSRDRHRLAWRRTSAAAERLEGWTEQITVRAPAFVTMSSETGTFQVTIVNDLDQPVTVGLRTAVAGDQLTMSTIDPVRLPARGRTAVRLDARARDIGVHQVVLQPVSESGAPVGEATVLSIRSSRVGFILWIVMAVGGGLLFVAVAVRIVRRIRQRRRTHGPLLRQGAS